MNEVREFYDAYDDLAVLVIWLPMGLILGAVALVFVLGLAPIWVPVYIATHVLHRRDAVRITILTIVIVLLILFMLAVGPVLPPNPRYAQ